MAAAPLLSLLILALAVNAGVCIEVSNKLDFWGDEEAAIEENEVEPRPPPLAVVDVRVVVANGSAATSATTSTSGSTEKHRDVPVYVPVQLVTTKPATSRPWNHHAGFAPTSTVSVPDVPVYVPVASSGSSGSSGSIGSHHKPHYDDVPVLIGSSGVKHVTADGSQKAVPVVVPISINISTGKEHKAPPTKHHDVPIVIGTASGKPHTATSTVPPDVPVVYGLNLGPRFHRRGGGGSARRPPPPLEDRTFWWPPVVALAPRPWLPPVQLPQFRPQPPAPVTARSTTTTTTTASSLVVDGKLDFDEA